MYRTCEQVTPHGITGNKQAGLKVMEGTESQAVFEFDVVINVKLLKGSE